MELQAQGIKREIIAQIVGVPLTKVHRVLRDNKKTLSKEHRKAIATEARRKNTPTYPPGTTDRILDLQKEGVKRNEIARRLNVSIDKVASDIQKYSDYSLTRAQMSEIHKRYSEDSRISVTNLRRAGESIDAIARQTGLSRSTVNYFCQSAGITLTSEQRAKNRSILDRQALAIKLKELFEDPKVTMRDATEPLKVSLSTVKRLIKENNLYLTEERAYRRFALPVLVQADIVNSRLGQGNKVKEIAQKHGLKTHAVSKFLHEHGLQLTDEQLSSNYSRDSKFTWGDIRRACVSSGVTFEHPDLADEEPIEVGVYGFRCRCGQLFSPRLYDFLAGKTRSCGCLRSFPQTEVRAFVDSLGAFAAGDDRSAIAPYELDVYVPSKSIAVEYCGLFWHGERFKKLAARTNHLNKLEMCESKGIRLVTIFADEWLNNRTKVESYLKAIFGAPAIDVGARKCAITHKKLTDSPAIKAFLEDHHIQGSSGHVAYTLEQNGVILAALTVRKSSPERRGTPLEGFWELSRYCVRGGYRVSGGFQRLLSAFVKDYAPNTVVTFADRRWSQGGLYKRAGFTLDGIVPPSYWYTKFRNDCFRFHKSEFRKEKIEQKLGPILDGETEWEAMQRFGYDRVWDCGLQRWKLDLPKQNHQL